VKHLQKVRRNSKVLSYCYFWSIWSRGT